MPEGPEILIISELLNDYLKNKTLKDIKILDKSRYTKKDIIDRKFDHVFGKKLQRVSFKGKKIIFDFKDSFLISFLGLEGRWIVNPINKIEHGSLVLTFTDGTLAYYSDSRHFGFLEYHDSTLIQNGVPNVGPSWLPSEMFKDTIKKEEFYHMLQNKRLKNKLIMDFLLEQKYTSGIGNYIRADALYLSKISPYTLINDITKEKSVILYNMIMKIMRKSVNSNGHTLKSYFTPTGTIGGYEPYIYGLKKSRDTKSDVIKDKHKGRSIYWVPTVQV